MSVSSAARTLKFGRQAGADEYDDEYDNGASGYDAYWKNLASGGQQDNYRGEDDEEDDDYEEEEEEEDDDGDEEEEEEEEGAIEKAATSMAGLKLDGSSWAQTESRGARTRGHKGSSPQQSGGSYVSGVFNEVDHHRNQISTACCYFIQVKLNLNTVLRNSNLFPVKFDVPSLLQLVQATSAVIGPMLSWTSTADNTVINQCLAAQVHHW